MSQNKDDKLIEQLAEALSKGSDVSSTLSQAETEYKAKKRQLKQKSMLFGVTSLVLVVVLAVLGVAWYTRVSNSYKISLEVADYDLAVNNNSDDEYRINVYSYAQIKEKKMAPGAIGWLPMEISAYHSDVDVTYSMQLTTQMPASIQKRVRIFYLKENGKIKYGDAVENTTELAKYKVNGTTKERVYLDFTQTDASGNKVKSEKISDTIHITDEGQAKTLNLYWEWYYDADEAANAGSPLVVGTGTGEDHYSVTTSGGTTTRTYAGDGSVFANTKYAAEADHTGENYYALWDELDTDIGRYPEKYKDAFILSISTSGTQVRPAEGTKVTNSGSGSGSGGSGSGD